MVLVIGAPSKAWTLLSSSIKALQKLGIGHRLLMSDLIWWQALWVLEMVMLCALTQTARSVYIRHICETRSSRLAMIPWVLCRQTLDFFVYRDKSANLPYYPDDALRLETMHNNVPTIPSHSACFVCKAGGELLTCSFCLLSSHRDCIDTMAFVFPDTLHVMLPRRIGSNSMCKCCAKIKFKNYS